MKEIDKEVIISVIKSRIITEREKHPNLDWELIAAYKIYDSVSFFIKGESWINAKDELPDYYKPVIGIFDNNLLESLLVWRAYDEEKEDSIYTISGTDIIAKGKLIKWKSI